MAQYPCATGPAEKTAPQRREVLVGKERDTSRSFATESGRYPYFPPGDEKRLGFTPGLFLLSKCGDYVET